MAHRTARGSIIDIDAIRNANADQPAIGNGSMNARGDIIAKGEIVQTRESLVDEYYKTSSSVRRVGLQQDKLKTFTTPDNNGIDPSFYTSNFPTYGDMKFITPEQIMNETKQRKLAAQAAIQQQEIIANATAAALDSIDTTEPEPVKKSRKLVDKE